MITQNTMTGSIKLLTFKGINLFVHWTFLLLIAWVLLVNAQFGNNIIQLGWSVVFLIFVFCSVLMHELAHAVVAARFGIKAHNIILLPIGGTASIEKFPASPKQELLISLAGPVVNIVVAGILAIYLFPLPDGLKDPRNISVTHGHDLIFNLFIVNALLAIINLLPAFPMDGGRILRAMLGFRLNYIRSTNLASATGKIVAMLLIVTGVITYNLILSLVGIFILISAVTEEYYLRLKSLVDGVYFRDVLLYNYNSLQAESTVNSSAGIVMSSHSKYFLVLDGDVLVGTINRMEIVRALAEKNYNVPVKNLTKDTVVAFETDSLVETALEQLAIDPQRIFPVLQKGHLIGVISLNHLIEYLLINKSDSKDFERIRSLARLV